MQTSEHTYGKSNIQQHSIQNMMFVELHDKQGSREQAFTLIIILKKMILFVQATVCKIHLFDGRDVKGLLSRRRA